jgi:hypothetical protein
MIAEGRPTSEKNIDPANTEAKAISPNPAEDKDTVVNMSMLH